MSLPDAKDADLKELTQFKDLTNLDLGPDVTDAGLKELAPLKKLKKLDLSKTQVTDAGLKELAPLTKLTKLNLLDTKVTGVGFSELAHLKNLKVLRLRGKCVTDAGVKELAPFTKLIELYLGGTSVTAAGLRELAPLKKLEILNLFGTPVSNDGAKHLAQFTKLTELGLTDTLLTDTGLKELAPLINLKYLYLGGTQVTDAGLKGLAPLKNLIELNLSETDLTDAGLKNLSSLKNLWTLGLDKKMPVTDAGVEAIQDLLPYCTVEDREKIVRRRVDERLLPVTFSKGISHLVWAGDERICIRRDEGKVEIVSIPSGKIEKVLEFGELKMTAFATSAGQYLCVAGVVKKEEKEESISLVVDLKSFKEVARIPLKERCYNLSGARNANGFVFDGSLMTITGNWKPHHDKIPFGTGDGAHFDSVAMSSDGAYFAASVYRGHYGGKTPMAIFDSETGKKCWSYEERPTYRRAAFTQTNTGHQLLFVEFGVRLRKVNLQKKGDTVAAKMLEPILCDSRICYIDVSAKGGIVCFATDGDQSKNCKVCVEIDGKVETIANWSPPSGYTRSLAMSPSGRYVGFTIRTKEGLTMSIYDREKKVYLTMPEPEKKSK